MAVKTSPVYLQNSNFSPKLMDLSYVIIDAAQPCLHLRVVTTSFSCECYVLNRERTQFILSDDSQN